jgi:NitT/TauT family transport system permease protein
MGESERRSMLKSKRGRVPRRPHALRGFFVMSVESVEKVEELQGRPVSARHQPAARPETPRKSRTEWLHKTVEGRHEWIGYPGSALRFLLRRWEILLVPVAMVAFVAIWALVGYVGNYPPFILPTPFQVWARFITVATDGSLVYHTSVTLLEILGGLTLGLTSATVLGYLLAKSPVVERLVSPYIIASQSVPIVALAPLLIVWFGFGLLSKVLVCALTIFFPVLISTIVGLRSVEQDLIDLMRSLQATRWQVFRHLEVPAALPVLLGGLKVGVTLSVIGAVVGEFAQSDRGLGFLVNLANRGLFDTPLMFVALFVLMTIALGLYGIVSAVEVVVLRWRRVGTNGR